MLTKREFVEVLAKKTGKTLKDSEAMIEVVLDTIQEVTVKSGGVKFVGFGSFETVEKAARTCVNPRNREEEINVPAYKAPKFKAGKLFKNAVKGE